MWGNCPPDTLNPKPATCRSAVASPFHKAPLNLRELTVLDLRAVYRSLFVDGFIDLI